MASIRDRGTSWQARHGQTVLGTFRYSNKDEKRQAKKDAQKVAFEHERKIRLGSLYEADPESFGTFLDAYVERKKKSGIRAKTQEGLDNEAKHLKPLRDLTVSSIRVSDIEDLVAALGPHRTTERVLWLVKAVLRSARSRDHTIDERILELKAPRYESREARFLTMKQLYELSSWLPERLKRIVTVAGLTGMRQGELFNLEIRDLDLDADKPTLRVRKGKTEAAARTVRLSAEAVRLLKEQLLVRAPGTNLVFPNLSGKRQDPNRFMQAYFRPARDSAGFEGLTFHHLRHSAISLMALAGWRAEHIAQQVGHTDGGALIHKTYRHLFEGEMDSLPAKLDALVEAR